MVSIQCHPFAKRLESAQALQEGVFEETRLIDLENEGLSITHPVQATLEIANRHSIHEVLQFP